MTARKLYINKAFEQVNIKLSEDQTEQFLQFYEYLVEKNKVMNLTGITDFEEVVQKHFVDSVSFLYIADMKQYSSMIDVGTGAGFPGIPVKIVYPHLEVVLLDSLNKRIQFLTELTELTGLTQVNCMHGRAEDIARLPVYRENFDLCVSRAVADLSVLSEYCLPFIKPGGDFVSYKSGNAADEVNASERAVHILGGNIAEEKSFTLPGSDIKRMLIRIRKESHTPSKYPRKPAIIKKKPL